MTLAELTFRVRGSRYWCTGFSRSSLTNTLPLHIEVLYNEYNFQAAFAGASLLAALDLVTLVVRSLVEWRSGRA